MAAYNREIISELANRLYSKAETVIITYTIIGVLLGGSICLVSKTSGIILAMIFGFVGFLIGNEKAFWYKFQAQVALCQAEIEIHTSNSDLSISGIKIQTPIHQSVQNTTEKCNDAIGSTGTAFTVVCQCGNPKMLGKACKKCGRT